MLGFKLLQTRGVANKAELSPQGKAAAASKKRGAADKAEDAPADDTPSKRVKTGAVPSRFEGQAHACCRVSRCEATTATKTACGTCNRARS